MKKYIPFGLVWLRLALAPVVLCLAYTNPKPQFLLVVCLWAALISDIFDGILARRWGIATEALRRADSRVDVIFWLSACVSVWWIRPDAVWAHRYGIIALFCLEPISDAIYMVRFRQDGCAHNWLSKAWGILLLLALSSVLGWGHTGALFGVTIVWGLLSQLDRIAIACLLPAAECDIPSAYHAYLRRQGKTFKRYKLFN